MKIHPTKKKLSIVLIGGLFLFSCGGSKSDNGDNGADKSGKKEKKDSTASKKDTSTGNITAAQFANAVKKRILERAKENGGILHLPDPRENDDTLKLKLNKVVKASVGKRAEDVRYVCAKFQGAENDKKYDIDFYLKGNQPSKLEPSREPLIHKIDGEARYEYVKTGDHKKPKKVDEGTKGKEES